jgi:hypothetical protein
LKVLVMLCVLGAIFCNQQITTISRGMNMRPSLLSMILAEFEHRFQCIIDPAGDGEAPERPAEVNTTSHLRT